MKDSIPSQGLQNRIACEAANQIIDPWNFMEGAVNSFMGKKTDSV
ncbi:uncharacterized protein METZ01_LOCUS84503 [marine metagenome]|uniref:Uncharacterized protein n=1 Tax=marine metagenome TaxID=408172 RepID=A0A381UU25_9ZZZZ